MVVYCRSGRLELIDTEFSNPNLAWREVELDGDDALALEVDYDGADVPKVSGQVTIRIKTPRAASIVERLRARISR